MVISGDNGAPEPSVEILVDSTWSSLAPLPDSRFYLQAVTWNNIVYVIGKMLYSFFFKCVVYTFIRWGKVY